ncbi:hypothetical protein [Vibrio parahaemolyticus]|uniref:hypothetical protein n=1 Tax=Vibrio parahaemolyticus TaxID=670 RepID=UPI003D815A9A
MANRETKNAYAYFVSNTGYRFISEAKRGSTFKVTIPMPEGGYFYASVGYKRIGKRRGIRKAVNVRNKAGKKLWGKHWDRVRREFNLLSRLPRNLEPILWTDNTGRRYYISSYCTYESIYDRKQEKHALKASVDKHGRMGAYAIVKRALLEAYKDNLELMSYMNRNLGAMFL